MKRYLFFLRHYNDIDNIAPAIYFFLERSAEHRADVIIYSKDYDFRGDHNIKLLEEAFGSRFSCKWLGSYLGLNADKHFELFGKRNKKFEFFVEKTKEKVKQHAGACLPFLLKMYNYWRYKVKNVDIICVKSQENNAACTAIRTILQEFQKPSLVCFDVNRTSQVKGLLDALKYYGVKKIVCLPVSPLINYNVLREYSFYEVESKHFFENHDYSGFDRIGCVDNHFSASFNKVFDLLNLNSTLKGKTAALGSIRFTPRWITIREKKLVPLEIKSEKIKTVFFLSRPKTNVNEREVEVVIKLLEHFPEYKVLIKRHTRFKDHAADDNALNISYTCENSSNLINWADVVLFWSTSIAIEGYIKDKTMVCLSYVSGNKNLYAYHGAGYIARCRDDLLEFLIRYKKGRKNIDYNYNGIRGLLDKDITPGGDDVIENYLNFMKEGESDLSKLAD